VRIDAPGVAWLTLDNPAKLNAMSLPMWQALSAALVRLEHDPAVRCCVLQGQGAKAFCVGADISQMDDMRSSAELGAEYDRITHDTLHQLERFPKPTVAMLSGYCLGAGVALAVACDLRVASSTVRLGVPSARLGIAFIYSGTKRLADLAGPSQAKRILYTGDRFEADEMLRVGVLDEVHAPDQLEARVQVLAATIAGNAPLSVAAAKHAVDTACRDAEPADISACMAREQACATSADHAEGRKAFLEKRAPVFHGR
jgi:enoyl-CoA hydratase/carnithine racemase